MACSCQLKDLRSPLSVVLISDPAVETPPAGGRAAAVDYLIGVAKSKLTCLTSSGSSCLPSPFLPTRKTFQAIYLGILRAL